MIPTTSQSVDDVTKEGQDHQLYLAVGNEIRSRRSFPPASTNEPECWFWIRSETLSVLATVHNQIHDTSTPVVGSPRADDSIPPNGQLASSTGDSIERELLLEGHLAEIFVPFIHKAENETFADGMHSEFADNVHQSITRYGRVAVHAWERVLLSTNNLHETGEELLRQMGLLEHEPSRAARLRVLKDNIKSHDARIRDAASLGLSFLDDPSALPALQAAYRSETEDWLKGNLKLVIDQFLDDADAAVLENGAPSPLV